MKTRDMIGLAVAAAILIAASVMLYTLIAPAPKNSGIQVSVPKAVVVPLSKEADQGYLKSIKLFKDYSTPQKCDDNKDKCTRGADPIF